MTIQDEAATLATRLLPLLRESEDCIDVKDGSILWIEDVAGVGFVAWKPADATPWSDTRTVHPELRQVVGKLDRLPELGQLEAFIIACGYLVGEAA